MRRLKTPYQLLLVVFISLFAGLLSACCCAGGMDDEGNADGALGQTGGYR